MLWTVHVVDMMPNMQNAAGACLGELRQSSA
jgi:hypothetical protein